MKARVIFALALCAGLLPLAGCSYSTDFVIVNNSGGPVEVHYRLKGGPPEGFASIGRPWLKAAREVENDDAPWQELREGAVAYDPETGTHTFVLPPWQAARVLSETGWRGHSLSDDSFPFKSLRLSGAGGVVSYEGKQAQYQFVYKNKNLYTLTYQGWGDQRDGD
jgi:hypothetical protein